MGTLFPILLCRRGGFLATRIRSISSVSFQVHGNWPRVVISLAKVSRCLAGSRYSATRQNKTWTRGASIRSRISAIGNPRTDIVGQLHQQSMQGGQQQFKGASNSFVQGAPAFARQQAGQQQQINLDRRIQPAGKLVIVKRGNVPKVGMPGASQKYEEGQRNQASNPLAATASQPGSQKQSFPAGGPKTQTLPNGLNHPSS